MLRYCSIDTPRDPNTHREDRERKQTVMRKGRGDREQEQEHDGGTEITIMVAYEKYVDHTMQVSMHVLLRHRLTHL